MDRTAGVLSQRRRSVHRRPRWRRSWGTEHYILPAGRRLEEAHFGQSPRVRASDGRRRLRPRRRGGHPSRRDHWPGSADRRRSGRHREHSRLRSCSGCPREGDSSPTGASILKIPFARPWFDAADEQSVLETLRSGWVGPRPKIAAFEQRFAKYVGSPHAATVSSCTAALHLAVLAAGFSPDDEVLVPAFTWISTPNAVEYAGAHPVFCDIDPVTFNIDMADAARRVTPRTRGIIPVHLFGLAADMDGVK